ncbi:flagellar filament capping protein FliD [Limnohabitans sp. Rim11]|uniref:flagellar filament capping protein FliD n=1 Tax=Limnohabitans sp. Rim11 TaxID=1100719 RepID=UPI000AABF1CD|nr:flagellar filament capping protein FliD [Limnohabitans sp. Rim11]
MAVNSSTSATGSSLDVASIVSQLMQVESKPLTVLDNKISKSTVKISALGQLKGQLSSLQAAINDLQTPSNFSANAATFSTNGIATAELTNAAVAGSYQIEVSNLALPSIWHVSNFTSEIDALDWFQNTAPAEVRTKADATVFKADATHYALSLKAKSTGVDAGFDSSLAVAGNVYQDQAAQNSTFKLNGIEFVRGSNTVADVLTGVTLNLTAKTTAPINLTVAQAASTARPKVEALVKAYNDLLGFYKAQTQSSTDAASRGVLNSDFAVGSMMRQLLNGLMMPLKGIAGASLTGASDLSTLGVKLQDNGQLAVDDTLFTKASTTLQARLAAGLVIGYDATTSKDLSTRITEMYTSGGVLQDRIDNEQNVQKELNTRKTELQEKLVTVQARYTAQYAALDALLFKLNSTSTSLKSALDGLTASQKNN